MTGVTIAYIGTVPTKSPSHWAESGTMVWQNCNENDGKEDALVYMKGSVHPGDRSGWRSQNQLKGHCCNNKEYT